MHGPAPRDHRRVRPQIRGRDRGALGQRQAGRRRAGARQTHHEHPLAVQTPHQRTLSVVKATRASRMEMIQKRTMIFGSLQPFFS